VNLSDGAAQALVQVAWEDLGGHNWDLTDRLSGVTYQRSGDELRSSGLYIDLGPWSYHFLRLSIVNGA